MALSLPLLALLGCLHLLSIHFNPANGQTLAFPGAEGFARYATGGRNGEVYIVTNLDDSGEGSFRDAVSKSNRIVVFQVGGIIQVGSAIAVSKDITIAAQTAPGDGIVLYGNEVSFTKANNTIVRYLRVRMGTHGSSGKDAVAIADYGANIIFDHMSISWGRDETFSVTVYVHNITIQNSIVSQGLQTHSCGGLIEPSGPVSMFRNLYIDNNTRNPKVKGTNTFINNVVYNWGEGGGYIMGGSEGDSRVNIINNYFIDGPSTTIEPFTRGTPTFIPYVSGNYLDNNLNGKLDGAELPLDAYDGVTTFQKDPFDYPMPENLMSTENAFHYVRDHAGATFPVRDQVDQLLIEQLDSLGELGELISDEKSLPTGGCGVVNGGESPKDSDRDGLPDQWEQEHGLDANDSKDSMSVNAATGYTYLEEYVNGLVA